MSRIRDCQVINPKRASLRFLKTVRFVGKLDLERQVCLTRVDIHYRYFEIHLHGRIDSTRIGIGKESLFQPSICLSLSYFMFHTFQQHDLRLSLLLATGLQSARHRHQHLLHYPRDLLGGLFTTECAFQAAKKVLSFRCLKTPGYM